MATNSSIPVWETPWTEEPGRLQSTGAKSQTQLSTITHIITDHLDVASRLVPPPRSFPVPPSPAHTPFFLIICLNQALGCQKRQGFL